MASKPKFEDLYPNIAEFVGGHGFVQIGFDDDSPLGYVVALNMGGTVFDGKQKYKSLDAALEDLDKGIADWFEEIG
jgi:hypothetical protein